MEAGREGKQIRVPHSDTSDDESEGAGRERLNVGNMAHLFRATVNLSRVNAF